MKTSVCPRCDSGQNKKIGESPVRGKWEVYGCRECHYVWRSTEDLKGISKKVAYWKRTAINFWD
jgi:transposase-like protein